MTGYAAGSAEPAVVTLVAGPTGGEDLTGAARVLVVFAHPDDETFGTGSLLLHLADRGAVVTVCCASRGEAGDVRDGVVVPTGGVAALREGELRSAATLLGVTDVSVLGFVDSGMEGDPNPGTVVGTSFDTVVQRVEEVVERFRPDVLVTLDGSDGHRDHVRMREVTGEVGRQHGRPVWLHCLPRRLMRQWAEMLAGRDPDSPYLALGELGTADEDITLRLDTEEHYEPRWEAIRLHASQASPFEALPDGLQRDFLTTEHLSRAH